MVRTGNPVWVASSPMLNRAVMRTPCSLHLLESQGAYPDIRVKLRGISYAVDHGGDVRRDLAVIRDELHCTAVLLYGAHIGRLRVAAGTARELGLEVWFQPRLPDQSQSLVLEHLGPRRGRRRVLARGATAA